MELMVVKEVRAVAETVVSGPVAARRALVAGSGMAARPRTAVVEMAVASVVVVVVVVVVEVEVACEPSAVE